MMALGARVRERRLVRGLTLEGLADKAGVTKGFLSQIENGKGQPTALPLLHLSRALGVSADYLLAGSP